MSSHPVQIVTIGEIMEHPNADRLEIAKVGDTAWQTIVGKGSYQKGDQAIYIPIDSLLDSILEDHLFPSDSKIKLSKSRVRSIKIRSALSQGMLVGIDDELTTLFPSLANKQLGDDVGDVIGVTKYEPPAPAYQQGMPKKGSWRNHPMLSQVHRH